MQEPLKVTLPPWRRGDGLCEKTGLYAIRLHCTKYRGEAVHLWQGEPMQKDFHYSGPLPIEFIETEPEPEPLTKAMCKLSVSEERGFWCCHQWDAVSGATLILIRSLSKQEAVLANNAAVRAMEGKQ